MPRERATELSGARLAARRRAGLVIAVLALSAFAALVGRRAAAQGSSVLDRFNGFESGGAGDYQAVGSPSGSSVHRLDAAGDFGLETAAAPGVNEYLATALSAPTNLLTDGIWACVATAPTGGARRIRSWLSGSDVVVEMRLNPSRQLQVVVNDEPVIVSSPAVAVCPAFSAIQLQYTAMAEGGTVMLIVDGNQMSGPHFSAAALDNTHIGPDDGAARTVSVVWDDHAAVRDVTFPGALRIAGLLPRTPPDPNDPNFRSEWPPSAGCSSAIDCTDEQPPDGDSTFVSASTPGAMQSFCMRQAQLRGVFGNILSVKSLLQSRTTAAPAALNLQLRANAQACAGVGGGFTSDPVGATIGAAYGAATRVDLALLGAPWTIPTLNRAALQVSLSTGANARVTQVVREVAFDTFGFASPTPTVTPLPTSTVTFTETATFTPSATFTVTATPTPSASATPTASVTPTASNTRTVTPTATISSTPTDTAPVSPTGTATSTRTMTSTPSATSSSSATSSATGTATASPTPILRGLARANGFEAEWAGEYIPFPAGAVASIVSGPFSPAHTGDFAAELPEQGFASYLTTTLPSSAQVFTDGIWACFDQTLSNPSRRIRHWFGNVATVAELFIRADARLQLNVVGYVGPPQITTTPLTACPTYTQIEVQYRALPAGGAAFLRMNGQTELSLSHVSAFTVDETRIGVDDDVAGIGPRLRWDDHTWSTGVVWPGNLGIIGLAPAADGFYDAWSPEGCPSSDLFSCVAARPPNPGVYASNDEPFERVSFCVGDPIASGLSGSVVAVKSLVSLRELPDSPPPAGLFLRSGGCNAAGGTDHSELPLDVSTTFAGFARLDETNPGTGHPWSVDDIVNTEFGVRHPSHDGIVFLNQVAVEVVYDPQPPTPNVTSTPTLTATRTRTMTPTVTTSPTATSTPSETPLPSVPSATQTASVTRTRTATASPSDTPLTPVDTPTVSATPSITRTPVTSGTATHTAPVTSPSLTATATVTATATATGPTPTVTNTFPPRTDYIFASGGANTWSCTVNEATELGLSTTVLSLPALANSENPDLLRNQYLSVYVAPGLDDEDYIYLQLLSAPPSEARPNGGFLDRFVRLGGLAVIHVAPPPAATPTTQTRPNVAPGGVGYQPPLTANSETIRTPSHPFHTGAGFGGRPLSVTSFSDWEPTDRGFLTDLPSGTTTLLANARGPTMIEYNHGAGKVIVSTLTFCSPSQPSSMGDPLSNLLKYGRFFLGGAQTPPPTLTATPTATATLTGQATRTSTRTRTPPVTPTASETTTPGETATPTPIACVGDCDGGGTVAISELLVLVNISLGSREVADCPAGDVSGADPPGPDGDITVDELVRAVRSALEGC